MVKLKFRPRSKLSRHGVFIMVSAWALTSVLGLIVVSVMNKSTSQAAAAPSTGRLASRNSDQPLLVGQKTTITRARIAVGYPVPLPNSRAADRANLNQVWVNSELRDVGLVFGNGKITITFAPATYQNPEKKFETFIKENREGKTAIGQVHGQPALVITPRTDPYNPNSAWVEFYSHGIDINIVSQKYGTAILLAVANSM